MKHLLTAIACCLAVAGSAQIDWPYNPNSNGDSIIDIQDFLDFLPYYGGEFVIETPSLPSSESDVNCVSQLNGSEDIVIINPWDNCIESLDWGDSLLLPSAHITGQIRIYSAFNDIRFYFANDEMLDNWGAWSVQNGYTGSQFVVYTLRLMNGWWYLEN